MESISHQRKKTERPQHATGWTWKTLGFWPISPKNMNKRSHCTQNARDAIHTLLCWLPFPTRWHRIESKTCQRPQNWNYWGECAKAETCFLFFCFFNSKRARHSCHLLAAMPFPWTTLTSMARQSIITFLSFGATKSCCFRISESKRKRKGGGTSIGDREIETGSGRSVNKCWTHIASLNLDAILMKRYQ